MQHIDLNYLLSSLVVAITIHSPLFSKMEAIMLSHSSQQVVLIKFHSLSRLVELIKVLLSSHLQELIMQVKYF